MFELKFNGRVIAYGTRVQVERDLKDLLEICMVEENKEKFIIVENEGKD